MTDPWGQLGEFLGQLLQGHHFQAAGEVGVARHLQAVFAAQLHRAWGKAADLPEEQPPVNGLVDADDGDQGRGAVGLPDRPLHGADLQPRRTQQDVTIVPAIPLGAQSREFFDDPVAIGHRATLGQGRHGGKPQQDDEQEYEGSLLDSPSHGMHFQKKLIILDTSTWKCVIAIYDYI